MRTSFLFSPAGVGAVLDLRHELEAIEIRKAADAARRLRLGETSLSEMPRAEFSIPRRSCGPSPPTGPFGLWRPISREDLPLA